jgi:hypothetical protein
MKQRRQVAWMGVIAWLGCSGGGGGGNEQADAAASVVDAARPDAAPPDAAPPDAATECSDTDEVRCDPVAQDCCAGHKCSWLTVQDDESGYLGRTACVPDGTVATGDACSEGAPGETTGFDDCAAGGLCVDGTCEAICTAEPDSCGPAAEFACSFYADLFTDDPNDNLGVCDPTCDPIAQDCPVDGDGCYLALRNGKATCSNIAIGAEALVQGDTCLHNDMNLCFLNGCAEGYGAFLFAGGGLPRDCTAFCSPVETYLIDPDGDGEGTLVATADANGAAPHDCTEGTIGFPAHQCRFFQSYFIDDNNMFLAYVPAAYGFCAPRDATFGNCNRYSEEFFLAEYDYWVGELGNDPSTYGDHIRTICEERPGGCPLGCITIATMDALDMAYCDANPAGPACAAGLRGARVVRRSLERYWAARLTD